MGFKMSDMLSKPAYRIVTPRLVIRCWHPADARLLKEAVDASIDHLRPWMPWAWAEPTDLGAKAQLLRRFRGQFDLDQDYVYGILDPEEELVMGGCGLHLRAGANAREIGYWIRAGRTGRGLATEAAAALTRVAFEVDQIDRLEIHCAPDNASSAAVPRKLGFLHEATLRNRTITGDGRPRDTMIWSMFAEAYPSSPAASWEVEAFDALGHTLI